jgi:MFS family permease
LSSWSAQDRQALRVALAGLVSLAVAMGLGRFAFTPILPMMLNDGLVDLPQASWLASSNYLGYLMGALACALQPWIASRLGLQMDIGLATLVRVGLVGTSLLTLTMVMPTPWAWAWLRWGAGLTSALVFIYGSGWCLSQLNRLGRPNWGGLIYVGPGSGILVSGLAATPMIAQGWPAPWAWLSMAALALIGTALAWPVLTGPQAMQERLAPPASDRAAPSARRAGLLEPGLTVFGYGLAGFGYIISATFLPVIARQFLPESIWLDLFWPVFGLGVCTGALLSTQLSPTRDRRTLLCVGFLVQAGGLTISLISPSVTGFVVGSFLLGLPFTALSFFAMQEARRLRGGTAASFMGLLTATYGLGQVLGPLLVAWMLGLTDARGGFDRALATACAALLTGAATFGYLRRRYPAAAVG